MEAADVGHAQAGILILLLLADSSVLPCVIVQFLNVPSCQLCQGDVTEERDDLVVDVALIETPGGFPDIGL